MWRFLAILVVVCGVGLAGPAYAQTATATPTPTPTPTRTPTPTPTITPAPAIACGAGPAAGGAQASGICGGTCLAGSVCAWDNSAANAGCICVTTDAVCDKGGIGQAMCSRGYCDRPPTMVGGNCTQRGSICRCD